MESTLWHPLQTLADLLTLRETFGQTQQEAGDLLDALPNAVEPRHRPLAAPREPASGHGRPTAHPRGYELMEAS